MILIENIKKEYILDKQVVFSALKGISFKIDEKEFTSIIGPSGSGKSTLMHIIGLLDKPTSGKIVYDGIDVLSLDDNKTSTNSIEFIVTFLVGISVTSIFFLAYS